MKYIDDEDYDWSEDLDVFIYREVMECINKLPKEILDMSASRYQVLEDYNVS